MKKERKDLASGPLMCWDFYMEGHYQRLQQAQGLADLQTLALQSDWRIDWDLEKLLLREARVVLLTDTAQIIRYASPNMPAMNGYNVDEVVGKTPKMFQGEHTCPNVRRAIREAIVRKVPFKGTLLNYRKNGTPYQCLVEEYPVWNRSGRLVNFIAFEKIAKAV